MLKEQPATSVPVHGIDSLPSKLAKIPFDPYILMERIALQNSKFAEFKKCLLENPNGDYVRCEICQFLRDNLAKEGVIALFHDSAVQIDCQPLADLIKDELKAIKDDELVRVEERNLVASLYRLNFEDVVRVRGPQNLDEIINSSSNSMNDSQFGILKNIEADSILGQDATSANASLSSNCIANYTFKRNLDEQGAMGKVALWTKAGDDTNYVLKVPKENLNRLEKLWWQREVCFNFFLIFLK